MIYDHIGGIRDPLKQELALEFYRNQNKVVSLLTEAYINHKRNNWLGSNFFSWSYTKGCLSSFIWDLKVDNDPKGRFVSFKFTPSNDRVLCVYAPSGYSTREQLDRGVSLKEKKNKGNESKIILEDFNCTVVKMDTDGAAPVMPYQISSWIMAMRIYGEGRTQIPLSSPTTIGTLIRIQDRQGLYWYKN